jgi:O-antigen/teichoic acid export membrane protein
MPKPAAAAVLTTAAVNVALAVIALLTGVLAARLLGPDGRGYLAAAQAAGTLVGAIGSLSLGEALVFFVGRQSRRPMVVLQTAALFAGASTVVLVGGALLLMPHLLAGQQAAVGAARAYTFIGLIFVLLGFPITFFRALQQYGMWNVLRLISPLCWLAALILFTLTGTRRVVPLIITFVLLQSLFIPFVWHLARARVSGKAGIDYSLVGPMLRYGTPLFLAALPYTLNLRLDQLIIANVETADQLGLYAVSVSWAGLSLPIMAAIGSVLFPRLASMDREAALATLASCSRVGVVLACIIGGVSAFTAPTLIPLLFGSSFAVPLALPLLLAGATSILGLNGIIEEGLRGLGEARSVLTGEATGLTVTVLLLFVLVPRMGITGAGAASLAGYAAVTLTLAWSTTAHTGIRLSKLLLPNITDVRHIVNSARGVAASWRQHNAE